MGTQKSPRSFSTFLRRPYTTTTTPSKTWDVDQAAVMTGQGVLAAVVEVLQSVGEGLVAVVVVVVVDPTMAASTHLQAITMVAGVVVGTQGAQAPADRMAAVVVAAVAVVAVGTERSSTRLERNHRSI